MTEEMRVEHSKPCHESSALKLEPKEWMLCAKSWKWIGETVRLWDMRWTHSAILPPQRALKMKASDNSVLQNRRIDCILDVFQECP
jgi:hypothetical protein